MQVLYATRLTLAAAAAAGASISWQGAGAIPDQKTRWTANLSFFSAIERLIVPAFY